MYCARDQRTWVTKFDVDDLGLERISCSAGGGSYVKNKCVKDSNRMLQGNKRLKSNEYPITVQEKKVK